MEQNILKIDLDKPSQSSAVTLLKHRLAYLHDLGILEFHNIESIFLVEKTKFGAKIHLKQNINEHNIIFLQLVLGSDWRKEVNTFMNHFIMNMEYSNRLFDCKRYKGGELKFSRKISVYEAVRMYVLNPKRKTYFN